MFCQKPLIGTDIQDCNATIGGVAKIEVSTLKPVTYTDPETGSSTTGIQTVGIDCIPETSSCNSELATNVQNVTSVVTTTINIVLGPLSSVSCAAINSFIFNWVKIKVFYADGSTVEVGDETHPCMLTGGNMNSGVLAEDAHNVTAVFTQKQSTFPVVVPPANA